MQIWLGKQYLGQRDSRQEIEHRGEMPFTHEVEGLTIEEIRAILSMNSASPTAGRAPEGTGEERTK